MRPLCDPRFRYPRREIGIINGHQRITISKGMQCPRAATSITIIFDWIYIRNNYETFSKSMIINLAN